MIYKQWESLETLPFSEMFTINVNMSRNTSNQDKITG